LRDSWDIWGRASGLHLSELFQVARIILCERRHRCEQHRSRHGKHHTLVHVKTLPTEFVEVCIAGVSRGDLGAFSES
jgi:hypothetical protein